MADLFAGAAAADQAGPKQMAFEGFNLSRVDVGEATLRVRHGGSGPPLLLLHGYPETHMMWSRVADDLARDFTVIAPDLRGYGESTAPATTPDHETYSKRAMARDAVALMRHFGFDRFNLAGHDRGGRVAYRLALDHPDVLLKLSILDIIPTADVWKRANKAFALAYWHWSFLAQAHPFPETVIGADPEYFLFRGSRGMFDPAAYADYVRCLANPAMVHAICEDYRAGASYDVAADEADRGKTRIKVPVQVLWGSKGALAAWYDVLTIWRDWADDVQGQAIESGHFIPEENPAETLKALRAFFL
ncbi:MAG: alpha/beta hydrolase [Phenylobacterium sp.]|uniref:alpha/beta fold hydrolase n=2 Tax=Phenylobacterium sp. TaxID=1871053 RepID=UPI0027304B42|nr:alpha/beta hydrolase [Phenylobacterium sp.]MDP2010596.1 alpha/beta hydrolase [Phenylobacterium sp.]MDP3632582.1 alpha/beta hydrolase [Phenylobacterium sp.]MDZ4052910.1 alpha/beta hydrolase [Phenylobacterium sp.]